MRKAIEMLIPGNGAPQYSRKPKADPIAIQTTKIPSKLAISLHLTQSDTRKLRKVNTHTMMKVQSISEIADLAFLCISSFRESETR